MEDLSHSLLADLVAINSVNPAYGGPGEAAVANYLRGQFAAAGLTCLTQAVQPGRDNVIGVLPGRDRSRRVVLEAHMDTVGVDGMTVEPFQPRIRDGHLFGRGSCDTKGGLAAMLAAVLGLASERQTPACDVWLAAVVDEEHAYRGVLSLVDGIATADGCTAAAIVAEPTSLRIVSATKGVLRFQIRLTGRAAHSSKPHLGTSAITAAAHVILALDTLHNDLATHTPHPLLGPATGSVGSSRAARKSTLCRRCVNSPSIAASCPARIPQRSSTPTAGSSQAHLPPTPRAPWSRAPSTRCWLMKRSRPIYPRLLS